MTDFMEITKQVLSDKAAIRTGYSEEAGASFVVAQDIKGAMNYTASTHMFLRGLEKHQEIAGQSKGSNNVSPLYLGTETVQTSGGPQQMKVVYKRGVFQLLMTSRRPEAIEYRDQIFDVLEQIERDGFYFKQDITAQQLEEAEKALAETKERVLYLEDELETERMTTDSEHLRNRQHFLDGVKAGRANPDVAYGLSAHFRQWEQGD